MPLREHEIKELESLWAENWVLMLCTDGAELFGAVTRTEIGLRLGPELIGPIPFSGLEELLDGDAMCQRIEDDAGLLLTSDDWADLLRSMLDNWSITGW